MKTLTKRKSLMGFIYALIMLLPFSSVLVRCLYVTFNKNAYQSYSQKVDTTIETIKNNDTINAGTLITATYNGGALYDNPFQINVLNGETDILKFFPNETFVVAKFNLLQSGGHTRLIVFDTNNNQYNKFNWEQDYSEFYFVNQDELTFTTINSANFNLTYVTYVNGSLDNAFDYSLYTFLNENGTGRLNLTDWFTDVFLNRTTHNLLYLNYINWYMNYSLLVSCVYLLYSVLMWFLTFARTLLNKPLKECD